MKVINQKIDLNQFFLNLSKGPALLILDYDGTLAPFSEDPGQAYPYPGIREKIQALMPHVRVVVLSGRDLQGLKTLLDLNPAPELWGSYGGEKLPAYSSHSIVKQLNPDTRRLLAKAEQEAKCLAPALRCEVKPLSVALHGRGIDMQSWEEQKERVVQAWEKHANGPLVEIHEFDIGIELRPQGINKAAAIAALLEEVPPETTIAYLGDDQADEEAFKLLGDRALKVLVRKEFRPTLADIHLTPPEELFWFLSYLTRRERHVG